MRRGARAAALAGLALVATHTVGAAQSPPVGSGFDEVMRNAEQMLERFWIATADELDTSYVPPDRVVAYTELSPVSTGCGDGDPGNAFYCAFDNGIYYDRTFLEGEFDKGDFRSLMILAHEWGHLAQATQDLVPANLPPVFAELQADCFAGGYAHFLDDNALLSEGDVEEAAVSMLGMGDPYISWEASGAHGLPGDRVNAFKWGVDFGARSCAESVFTEFVGSEMPRPFGAAIPEGSLRGMVPIPRLGPFILMDCKTRTDLLGINGITDALQCRYETQDGTQLYHEFLAKTTGEEAQAFLTHNQERFQEDGFIRVDGGRITEDSFGFGIDVGVWVMLFRPTDGRTRFMWTMGSVFRYVSGSETSVADVRSAYFPSDS